MNWTEIAQKNADHFVEHPTQHALLGAALAVGGLALFSKYIQLITPQSHLD